jgi:phage tail sheath protein FI
MPTQLTYPGVYVEEIPSGVRTITGVATSITAFIGRADRGPADDAIVINSFADYERTFGGLSLLSPMSFAVRDFYLNGGRQAIIVRVHNGATAATISVPAGYGTLVLEAANVGAWGKNLAVAVDHDTLDSDEQVPDANLFNLTVQEIDPETKAVEQTETFLNVSILDTDARYVARVLEEESSLVRLQKVNNAYPTLGARPDATADHSPPLDSISADSGSGSDGSDVDTAQYAGSQTGKTGLYALEKADLFNLLCIPPYSFTKDVAASLLAAAARYCSTRRAMLIVDPPASWTTKDTARDEFTQGTYPGITGPDRTYGAIFFPRLKQSNPLHDYQVEAFAPCGTVAGVFARTDSTRGVWKAPAGQDAGLVGVAQLTVPLTDDENGELNQLGLNCLRAFPVVGRVVWGSRTLDGADRLASEWKYIPVRRTALYIEESLYRGTKWVVFEPNDEPLWALIRLNVGAFMQTLFRQGAFQGTSARDAYFVKCDKETTTQNDIDLGIVNILVGFAPLKPAEFVVIRIQQIAGEIQT